MSENEKGNVQNWTLVLPVGALTLLGALMLSVSNEAAIALKLSEQHGESILLLREEIRLLRQELKEGTKLRYTSIDAQRDLQYIERSLDDLRESVKELEDGD